jgi:6,7-dimethyl-8-ribityllumazine synthase
VNALMQVQLDVDVPVLSVMLTPHHFQEMDEHHRVFLNHFKITGKEAAQAYIGVLAARDRIAAAA